jgi:lipoprotein-anchoring transpeptidase ErfK/SrfK
MVHRPASFMLLVALLIGACTSSPPAAHRLSKSLGSDLVLKAADRDQGDAASDTGSGFDLKHILTDQTAWVAVASRRYLPMYKRPGTGSDPAFAFDTRNPVGRKSPFLIQGAKALSSGTWLRVLLPIRPNGRTAWVKDREVRLIARRDRVVVDLSRRMLWHYRNGRLVDRFSVGVGTSATPTATGTFYIYLRVPQSNPYGPYGILAYGLSGFSPVISDWPGGGRMAMHGTPYESNKGQAVSHGCVRVWNEDLKRLRDLPLGTPVIIRR